MWCAGPSASLTFSWGSCTFNESQVLDSSETTKILNCTEPSITYDKEPAIFTSKYTSGGSYTGKVSTSASALHVSVASQNAACTSKHHIAMRLARWHMCTGTAIQTAFAQQCNCVYVRVALHSDGCGLLQSCTISKDFGEDSTQVLYVFDDAQSLDVLNVTAILEQKIASLQDSSSWMPASSNVQSTILALLPGASSSSAASSTAAST